MAPGVDTEVSNLAVASPLVVKKNTNGSYTSQTNGRSETHVTRETSTQQNKSTTKTVSTSSHHHFSTDQQITILHDTIITTRKSFCTHFDHWDEHNLDVSTIDGFLEYIERQRLTHIPHRGSTLDRVLKWAEYFAIQVSGYATAVAPFIPESDIAAKLIWEGSKALLELGPENGQALEPTFNAFYKLGLSLSFFLRHNELLYTDSHIRREVGEAFNDMLVLVSRVSIHYKKIIRGISRGPVSLDFNQTFSANLKSFYQRKAHIVDSMWKYKLGNNVSLDITTLRKWLGPDEQALKTILRNRKDALEFREEYTCEWFQRYLLDFSRGNDKVLAVTGPAGSGKTYLSGWIVERLQRPVGKKTHQVISCSIHADISSQATSLAVAQSLALQLLEVNVGDESLFEKLDAAYDISKVSTDSKVEEKLWEAINVGLDSFSASSDNLMIVVDGLDELQGGKDTVTSRVQDLASKHKNVQAIFLSRGFTSSKPGGVRSIAITPDHTHTDIEQVLRHKLSGYVHYEEQKEHERESIVEKLVRNAKGSFLWATLMTEQIKKETSQKGFTDAYNSTPSIDNILQKILASFDLSKPDFNHLFAWTLASERPLSVNELKCLFSVDLEHKQITERKIALMEDLQVAKSVLSVNDGYVVFKHGYIRNHLLSFQADKKKIPVSKEAQKDLTMRLLAYLKFVPSRAGEISFEQGGWSTINDRFRSHALMEYALRTWTQHFRQSSMWKESGHFEYSPELKAIFPGSTELSLMEWTCWESQYFKSHAISVHELALRIRTEILTEKHTAVLQNLIVIGSLYYSLSKLIEAANYFYQASTIGQSILSKYSTITVDCTSKFLSCTESITVTTRTEIVTKREHMLKYIITAHKHTHGETSDIVISYYKVLAQLYVDIREEAKAEIIWRELHEVIIKRYGKGSEEETSIARDLVITLKKENKEQDVVAYDWDVFQTTKTLEIWDARRIEVTLKLALTYESRGEIFLAEELYITLWTQLTQHCHHTQHHHGVEVYISVIDIALEYVRFLRRCHRHEEAANILICVWEEYEEYEFDSEIIFLRLKIVGELMRAVSLLSIAVSVFKKCWSWFSSHSKEEYVRSCEILIKETVEEIITTTTKTTTTTTTTTTTETVIKEVFESAISRTTVTSETISICQSLISFYMKLENWTEAITITERSLTLIWKMIISGSGTCALPKRFDSEAIDIAIRLAICHYRAHHFHEAEEIYIRIYRASRVSCHINDERVTKSYVALIKFYEEHHHWEQMIEIYKELLVEYRQHLGVKHTLTIKTLYILGQLCTEHGFGHGFEYYEEIVRVCNGSSQVCHNDAKDAMIFLCKFYHESGLWENLKSTCHILWTTWTHHHHEHKFEADFVETLYKRYIYVLQFHAHSEYEVLRKITIEFRDTCVKVFTTFSAITIKAMIELAGICMKSSKHVHEAVAIYEEVITKTTTTTTTTTTTVISTETIKTVKEKLSQAYIVVCSHDSVTTTTIEKAIKILVERFEYLKVQFGYAHTTTLIILRELVLLHWKLKTTESHATVVGILQESVINIITKEKHAKALHEAAITIGEIYGTCGLNTQGLEIVAEIRRQIITKSSTHSRKYTFKVDQVNKSSYVFIVTLERILRGSTTITYSEIMTELLTETTLYEHYHLCLESKKDATVIMTQAAKLRAFLLIRHRDEEVKHVEKTTFEIFVKKWGGSLKTQNRNVIMVFYTGILSELAVEGAKIYLGNAACMASNTIVLSRMSEGRYQDAYDLALCAFHFIDSQGAFKHLQNIGYGVKLSAYMANRDIPNTSGKAIPQELYTKMIELSQAIIKVVFQTCKDHDISFVRLQLSTLNELVGLLGAQQNYTELENLLLTLWRSREVQKNWTSETTLAVGLRLVQVHKLASHPRDALRLCEDICYNLRRVWGSLAPMTLRMQEVLSQLYTAAGHYREAMGVHEDILRLIVEGDDGDDRTQDTVEAGAARKQIELLRRSHNRLNGWDKSEAVYKELVDGVIAMYKGHKEFEGVTSVDKWSIKEEDDGLGKFAGPAEWSFATEEEIAEASRPKNAGAPPKPKSRPGLGMKRASSNWGLKSVYRKVFGDDEEEEVIDEKSNGNGYANGKTNGSTGLLW